MNDEEAIRQCQDGNKERFRHIVERYKDVLYGTAYLMTSDPSAADDHVQEAFISAWKNIGSFQIGRPVKPWLVRILVNKVLSQRRNNHPPAYPIEAADDSADRAGGPAEDVEDIQLARLGA